MNRRVVFTSLIVSGLSAAGLMMIGTVLIVQAAGNLFS